MAGHLVVGWLSLNRSDRMAHCQLLSLMTVAKMNPAFAAVVDAIWAWRWVATMMKT